MNTNISWNESATSLKGDVVQKLYKQKELLPKDLWWMIHDNCILSGSCASSIYHKEEPKDYDFWMHDPAKIQWVRDIIIRDYSDYIMDVAAKYGNLQSSQPLITENAITLVNDFQIITLGNYYTERKKFDYIHCLPYLDLVTNVFYISENQLEVIAAKRLVKNPGGREPVAKRQQKFLERGWTLDNDDVLL
jgi:hypothetical protein